MSLDLISWLVLAGVIGPMLALDVLHRDAPPFRRDAARRPEPVARGTHA